MSAESTGMINHQLQHVIQVTVVNMKLYAAANAVLTEMNTETLTHSKSRYKVLY